MSTVGARRLRQGPDPAGASRGIRRPERHRRFVRVVPAPIPNALTSTAHPTGNVSNATRPRTHRRHPRDRVPGVHRAAVSRRCRPWVNSASSATPMSVERQRSTTSRWPARTSSCGSHARAPEVHQLWKRGRRVHRDARPLAGVLQRRPGFVLHPEHAALLGVGAASQQSADPPPVGRVSTCSVCEHMIVYSRKLARMESAGRRS